MASESRCSKNIQSEQRLRSVFDVPLDFFNSCRILHDGKEEPSIAQSSSIISSSESFESSVDAINEDQKEDERDDQKSKKVVPRWSCNTCKAEFESLQDQRSHFKSDIHRFNVKLSIAGKTTVKEEDFDELTSDSLFKDYDISSISGSEDEDDKGSGPSDDGHRRAGESFKKKLFFRLQTGETVSIWKCLLLDESENLTFDNDHLTLMSGGRTSCLQENEVIERLKSTIHEPRDSTHLRIVLLASGGHFAGCVFDGNSVVAHKTYHRYVVRARAGKKQSSKDASGKAANSAGASLRRYNELALKKVMMIACFGKILLIELNHINFWLLLHQLYLQLVFISPFFFQHCIVRVRHVPFTVRRPTFREAKGIYNHLTHMAYEVDEKVSPSELKKDSQSSANSISNASLLSNKQLGKHLESKESDEAYSGLKNSDALSIFSESENEVIGTSTPLHEAAKSGDAQKALELLEQGLNPCTKDERGRTPYMLATEKEVRDTFRRFMALNLDKWDWHAAKVPSPLTKEMEESQAAKQAEKDAKKKARAKELKKLRKAKEKKAQAEAVLSQNTPTVSQSQGAAPVSVLKGKPQSSGGARMSKEEELKRAQAEEREKRAAAAERRIAAAAAYNAQGNSTTTEPSSSGPKSGVASSDINCSCCNASLAGKIPFHSVLSTYPRKPCFKLVDELSQLPCDWNPLWENYTQENLIIDHCNSIYGLRKLSSSKEKVMVSFVIRKHVDTEVWVFGSL
ncbi:hypothetical protein HHK36_028777 [Tetracentron sinense]|uniref:VLRF1 domain-containing protein n=1 Tax=Tetracentron sinense TaxID=13715 RepID=A0A834YBQ8_TETSI|nr:hypothetical protein HHK36_028777 [Tetracentron sinense]